jgi:uncharacterized protein (TIRG00374 family)
MRFVRKPLVWVGLAISIGALLLAFRGLHWGDVRDSIAGANYPLLVLAIAVLLLSLYTRAIRWGVLLHRRTGFRMAHLFGALNVGYALNNLLPLRVGELGRVYLICETEDLSAGHALSSIVVERTLDTLTIVALLIVTLPFIDAPAWARGPALLVGVGFLALAVLLATVSAADERAMALLRRLIGVLPDGLAARVERVAETGLQGFAVIRRPAVMAQAAAWSAVSWLLSALVMYIVMQAFDLSLPFTAALFVMCAIGLGMVVPSSPGYVGVFHAIAIESLVNVFDVNRSDAASFAFVQHAMLYLTPIALSIMYFMLERGAWQDVRLWAFGRSAPLAVESAPADTVET